MTSEWLQWYYLIYALPAGVAILVLLASGLAGHHSSSDHGSLHAGHDGFGAGHHGLDVGHHGMDVAHHGLDVAHHAAIGHHDGLFHHGHDAGGHAETAAHVHDAGGHAETAAHVHDAGGHAETAAHGHMNGDHGHDAGQDHDADGGGRASVGLMTHVLSFFGIGRAPVTIVAGSFLIGWGVTGIAATQALRASLTSPNLFALPAMGIAAAGAIVSTKVFGELCARVMPREETCSVSREDLVGLTATVVYPVSVDGGRVHIYDQFRTLHDEFARVPAGQPPIGKGTSVTLTALEPEGRFFLVEPVSALQPPAA